MKKRIAWIDMAKGLGMIFVILAHLDERYLKIPIYSFHMPLFFFLSGYTFSLKENFKTFFLGKCKRLLLPYIGLGGILVAFVIYWNVDSYGPFGKEAYIRWVISSFFIQNRFQTLWFLACLFFLNLIFYVLIRYIKKEWMRAAIVFGMTVFGVLYFKNGGVGLPWNVDVCFTVAIFFYAGYWAKNTYFIEENILGKKHPWFLFVGTVFLNVICTILTYAIAGEGLELFFNQYGVPAFTYIGAFAGIGAIIIVSDACRSGLVKYIGENTLIYFAWHQAIAMPLVDYLYKKLGFFQGFYGVSVYMCKVLLSTFLILLALSAVNLLFCKTKLRIFVGKGNV